MSSRTRACDVIGTTTATLTRHAPCPVLTVPGDLLVIEEQEREHEALSEAQLMYL